MIKLCSKGRFASRQIRRGAKPDRRCRHPITTSHGLLTDAVRSERRALFFVLRVFDEAHEPAHVSDFDDLAVDRDAVRA